MMNDDSMTNNECIKQTNFDLEQRTLSYGKEVVRIAAKFPENNVTRTLISQFVKSGTSIGANYCEANNAESKNDFKHKIGICKKESRETMYWLSLLSGALPEFENELKLLWKEAKELTLIFGAIIKSSKNNK